VAAGAAEVDVAAVESGAAADGDEIAVVAVSSLALGEFQPILSEKKQEGKCLESNFITYPLLEVGEHVSGRGRDRGRLGDGGRSWGGDGGDRGGQDDEGEKLPVPLVSIAGKVCLETSQ